VREHLGRTLDGELADIVAAKILLLDEFAHQLDWSLGGDVAGVAFDADAFDLVDLAQTLGEQRRVVLLAKRLQHAIAPFDHCARPFIAAPAEAGGQHAAFGRAADMPPLTPAAAARPGARPPPTG